MLKRDFYAHTSPEGETVQDRYVAAGGSRWELVAENIARCVGCSLSADMVRKLQQDWMESPEHRRNILARGLERFGFGIVLGDDGTLYAVQTFAGPGVAQNLAEGESAQPVKGKQAAGIMLDKINAVRRQSGASPLRLSETLSTAASALLPESDDEPFAVRAEGGLYDALPDDRPRQWRRLATASGACGGCGREPARSDVAAFADNWLEDPGIRRSLLDENLTHLGFDITANGRARSWPSRFSASTSEATSVGQESVQPFKSRHSRSSRAPKRPPSRVRRGVPEQDRRHHG